MTDQSGGEVVEERLMSRARTIGSFGATTVLSGGISVLSIPLIVLLTNSHAWGSIALGQAVGSSVGVLAMFGWGITGPAGIAMMHRSAHAAAYWDSIVARGLLFLPALVITSVVTWLLVPTEQLASTVCAVAMAFGGLSGSWYAVGRKRPDRLFLLDTVPRVGGTIVGIAALWLGGSLVAFGLLQLAGSFIAFLLITRWALPGFRRPEGTVRGFRRTLTVIAEQRHGVAVAVAIASYYPIVLAIVAGFAPTYLPLYALIEKVLRFATMAMQPVFQFFQATVPTRRGRDLRRAIKNSLLVILALAVVCWLGFSILLPVASGLLTAGQVKVPLLVAINLGAYMAGVVIMNFMSSVALVAVSRVRSVGRGSLIGSVLGLAVVLLLAILGDGRDISWGFVATAVLILGYQFVVLAQALPRTVAEVDEGADPEVVH
ncbi:MAG: hypothetical protein JWN09_2921 [Microbacteriaceae bacterium]|nr:hypothetical protein [Microbacteriaceae bacterium]